MKYSEGDDSGSEFKNSVISRKAFIQGGGKVTTPSAFKSFPFKSNVPHSGGFNEALSHTYYQKINEKSDVTSKHSYATQIKTKMFQKNSLFDDNKSLGGQPSNILDKSFCDLGMSEAPSIAGASDNGGINDYKSQISYRDLTDIKAKDLLA